MKLALALLLPSALASLAKRQDVVATSIFSTDSEFIDAANSLPEVLPAVAANAPDASNSKDSTESNVLYASSADASGKYD